MTTRVFKQVLYAILFLGFWGLLFGGIYLWKFQPLPSCVDNRQNQDEEGVDCGGVCGKVCLYSGFKQLQVVGSGNIFFPDATHVSILARLQNSNPDYAAPSFSYAFILKDTKDNMLEVPGNSFIYPGEIKYLTALQPRSISDGSFDFQSIQSVSLKITQPQWVKGKDFPRPQLRVSEQSVSQQNEISVHGMITNEDVSSFSDVEVVAIFSSTKGQPLGVSFTRVDSLPTNSQQAFVIVHPLLSDLNPDATQIIINARRPGSAGALQ